jgi:hypothetical protein
MCFTGADRYYTNAAPLSALAKRINVQITSRLGGHQTACVINLLGWTHCFEIRCKTGIRVKCRVRETIDFVSCFIVKHSLTNRDARSYSERHALGNRDILTIQTTVGHAEELVGV